MQAAGEARSFQVRCNEPYERRAAPRSRYATPLDMRNGLLRDRDEAISLRYVESFFGRAPARLLMKDAGLVECDGRPKASVTRTDFWMMCLASINHANDENHGCTRVSMPKSSWTMVFSTVNQMDTIGGGLRRFAELVSVIPCGLSVSLGYGANSVKLNFSVAEEVEDRERAERYAELMALVFHCVLLWGANRVIRPLGVRLSDRLDIRDGSMAGLLSRMQVRSGEGTTITYSKDDMGHPLGVRRYKSWATHETSMFLELVGKPAASNDAEGGERSLIVSKLQTILRRQNLSQQEIARTMGMSVATLQRRLAETGDSFRDISRNIRVQKLQSLLATDSNLDDIAMELGFSERRSLWRACQDWLGMSPAGYRQMLRARNKGADVAAVRAGRTGSSFALPAPRS